MSILDEVFGVVPGAQHAALRSTGRSGEVIHGLDAWLALQLMPNYNAPSAAPPPKDFAVLGALVEEAEQDERPWTPDADEDLAEQRENAAIFQTAQLDALAGQDD